MGRRKQCAGILVGVAGALALAGCGSATQRMPGPSSGSTASAGPAARSPGSAGGTQVIHGCTIVAKPSRQNHTKCPGANLSGLGVHLAGADLSYANLSHANLSDAILPVANLGGADLSYAKLTNATLLGVDMSHADLANASASGAVLYRANLEGANLTNTGLWNANLTSANFRNSDLSYADLPYANLTRADLQRCRSIRRQPHQRRHDRDRSLPHLHARSFSASSRLPPVTVEQGSGPPEWGTSYSPGTRPTSSGSAPPAPSSLQSARRLGEKGPALSRGLGRAR